MSSYNIKQRLIDTAIVALVVAVCGGIAGVTLTPSEPAAPGVHPVTSQS